MNERILASIFEKTLTLDAPKGQNEGDEASKSLARIERDMAAVRQGIAGLKDRADSFWAAGRGGSRPFAPKPEPKGGDASAPERKARTVREPHPERSAPDKGDSSDAQRRLKERQAADAFRKALEGALGAQKGNGADGSAARSADEFQQAVLGRLDAVGKSTETSAMLARRAGRREAFAKGDQSESKPKFMRPDATAKNALEAAEESLALDISESKAAAKRHKELIRAVSKANKSGGGMLGKLFGGLRDALFRRAMLRGLSRAAAAGMAGKAAASAMAGMPAGKDKDKDKKKPKGRAAARGASGRYAARGAAKGAVKAGARGGLLGGIGRTLGRAGAGVAAAGRGLLGGAAAAGRGAAGLAKGAARGAAGLAKGAGTALKFGARAGAGALKVGARAAIPLLGAGLALYDAHKGWSDQKLHQQAFGLKDGQKASTGQKASAAAANLLDMGGLLTGGLRMLGMDVSTADLAKAVYGVGSSIGGFVQKDLLPAVKGALASFGQYFASGRALQDAKAGLSALANLGSSIWSTVAPILSETWQTLKDTVVPLASQAASAIGEWFASGQAEADIKAGLSKLGDMASLAWGAVSPALTQAWESVQAYVASGKLKEDLVVGADKLADIGGKIVAQAGEWVGKAWDAIGEWFASGEADKDASKALDFAKGVGEALWAGAKRFAERVWAGVKDVAGKAFDKMAEKIEALWKDLEEGVQGWIDDKIEGAVPKALLDYMGWKRSTPKKEERENRRIVDDGTLSDKQKREYRERGYKIVTPEEERERREQAEKAPDDAYISLEHASDNDRAQAEKDWQARGYRTEWTKDGDLHVWREAGGPPAPASGEPSPAAQPKPLEALPPSQTPPAEAAQGKSAKPKAKPEAKPAEAKPEAVPAEAKAPLGRAMSERLKAGLAKPAEAKAEGKPEAKPEGKPEAKPAEAKAEAKPEAKPEPAKGKAEPKSEAKPEAGKAAPEAKPEAPKPASGEAAGEQGRKLEIPARAATPTVPPATPPTTPPVATPVAIPPTTSPVATPATPAAGQRLFGDFKSRADGKSPEDAVILAVEDFRKDFQKYAEIMIADQRRREDRERRIDSQPQMQMQPGGAGAFPPGGTPPAQGYVPDAGGQPPAGGTPPAGSPPVSLPSGGRELGWLTQSHETGNAKNPTAFISKGEGDKGGVSYGSNQLASKAGSIQSFLKYLQTKDPQLYAQLAPLAGDATNYNGQFANKWRELAADPNGALARADRAYKVDKYFGLGMKQLDNVDPALKARFQANPALAEMLLSVSRQHGEYEGVQNIFRAAGVNSKMTDEQIIEAVYNERGKEGGPNGRLLHFPKTRDDWQDGLRKRFREEKAKVLAYNQQLKSGAVPAAKGSATPPAPGPGPAPAPAPAAGTPPPASGNPTPAMQAAGAQAASGLSAQYAAATQDAMNRHVRYGFGHKNSYRGSIDCSGWVSEMNRTIFASISDEGAKQRMNKVLSGTSAAGIIQQAVQVTGQELHNADLAPDRIREGTMIGIDHGDKGWDRGRYRGIDHIVQTYRDPRTGEMMVSESTSGKGVTTSRYADWYARQQRQGARMYGADVNAIAQGAVVQGGYPTPSGGAATPMGVPPAPGAVSPVRQLGADSWQGSKDAAGNMLVHDAAVAEILTKILRAVDPSQKASPPSPAPSGGASGNPLNIPKDYGDPKLEAMAGR